jgi:tripartite-type tricarboxylate transporter receptor subunit TctC
MPSIYRSLVLSASSLLATAVLMAVPGAAQGQQNFPSKPIRLVVPAAGNAADTVARMIGPKMSDTWKQPVVVENRAGAGGTMAAGVVAKAAPDGHSLLLISSQFPLSAALHSNLPYQPLKDFAGVSQIGYSTSVLLTAPALGLKSIKDLIALAQSQPGKILFSSGGAGSNNHMIAELFKFHAGIKTVHVGFKSGSEAMIEVLAGRVHYCMANLSFALPFIKDARLQALGVTTQRRSQVLPNVPAIAEVVPGFKSENSYGLYAPAGTPRPVLDQLSKGVARILLQPDIKDRFQSLDMTPAPSTPEELDKMLAEQIAMFSKLVKDIGLRSK